MRSGDKSSTSCQNFSTSESGASELHGRSERGDQSRWAGWILERFEDESCGKRVAELFVCCFVEAPYGCVRALLPTIPLKYH